jgi:hypothetical protein
MTGGRAGVKSMRKQKGPDIRDVKPTIVLLRADLTFNGGTLSADPIGKIWRDVLVAFEKSAHKHGLGSTWMGELHCRQPKAFQATLDRLRLCVDKPKSADALGQTPENPT